MSNEHRRFPPSAIPLRLQDCCEMCGVPQAVLGIPLVHGVDPMDGRTRRFCRTCLDMVAGVFADAKAAGDPESVLERLFDAIDKRAAPILAELTKEA